MKLKHILFLSLILGVVIIGVWHNLNQIVHFFTPWEPSLTTRLHKDETYPFVGAFSGQKKIQKDLQDRLPRFLNLLKGRSHDAISMHLNKKSFVVIKFSTSKNKRDSYQIYYQKDQESKVYKHKKLLTSSEVLSFLQKLIDKLSHKGAEYELEKMEWVPTTETVRTLTDYKDEF